MPYPKPKTWTLNLGEFDAECADLNVVVKSNASLPASTGTKMARAQAVFAWLDKESKKAPEKQKVLPESDRWALSAPQELLDVALVSWNLPYPDDYPVVEKRGQVIPLHDPAEPDPWGAVPTEVFQFILRRVMVSVLTPSKSTEG